MSPLITALLTLAGGIAVGVLSLAGVMAKLRADSRDKRADREAAAHQAAGDAAVAALADFVQVVERMRVAMWDLESDRFRGGSAAAEALLARSREVRDQVSPAQYTLMARMPSVATLVTEAVQAVYAMDSLMDPAVAAIDPVVRKDAAKAALHRLITRARMDLRLAGVGLAVPTA